MSQRSHKSEWEEINLKNFLSDAKKMDAKNLAQRYNVSLSYVSYTLKKHKVEPKKPYGYVSEKTLKNRIHKVSSPDMIDLTEVTAKPSKNKKYILEQFPYN